MLTLAVVCYLNLNLDYTLEITTKLKWRRVRWLCRNLPQLYKTHFIGTPHTRVIFCNHSVHKKSKCKNLRNICTALTNTINYEWHIKFPYTLKKTKPTRSFWLQGTFFLICTQGNPRMVNTSQPLSNHVSNLICSISPYQVCCKKDFLYTTPADPISSLPTKDKHRTKCLTLCFFCNSCLSA